MDNKITIKRLKNFITYDLIRTIATTLAICVVIILIINFISPKPTSGQEFTLLVDDQIVMGSYSQTLLDDIMAKNDDEYGFSYDILRTKTTQIVPGEYGSYYMLDTYSQVNYDDIFVCADMYVEDKETKEKVPTLYDSFIYNLYAYNIVEYYEDALKFALPFFDGDQINQTKVKNYFASERGRDARFRKDSEYYKGLEKEISRIKAIKNNATKLKYLCENFDILYKNESVTAKNNKLLQGYFAIDVNKLAPYQRANMPISNVFARDVYDDKGFVVGSTTENVLIMVGANFDVNGDLFYEGLAFINYFIKTYTTLLD